MSESKIFFEIEKYFLIRLDICRKWVSVHGRLLEALNHTTKNMFHSFVQKLEKTILTIKIHKNGSKEVKQNINIFDLAKTHLAFTEIHVL